MCKLECSWQLKPFIVFVCCHSHFLYRQCDLYISAFDCWYLSLGVSTIKSNTKNVTTLLSLYHFQSLYAHNAILCYLNLFYLALKPLCYISNVLFVSIHFSGFPSSVESHNSQSVFYWSWVNWIFGINAQGSPQKHKSDVCQSFLSVRVFVRFICIESVDYSMWYNAILFHNYTTWAAGHGPDMLHRDHW